MSEKKENLAQVDDLEVDPLTDEDLESVAGGAADCSCTYTTGDCTAISEKELQA